MDSSPSKRALTEATLDLQTIADGPTRNDGVSDELRALLRNRAARVRKSVMEGYSIDRTAPLQNEHTDPGDGVAEPAQIFQSSRDINRQVLRNWTPSPFSSPKKRSRHHYEADDALEEEGVGENMEIDPIETNLQNSAEDISQRTIKPLRRTLFADVAITSKPSVLHAQPLCLGHDDSCSENPFLE